MSYREKTAWLSLFAMAVTYGPYFAVSRVGEAVPNLRQLGLFALTTIVQLLILGAGHLYLRHQSPEEARTPPDERDRVIVRRSISTAYYVLIAGMIVVGVVMPFQSRGWTIINAALFMIVAAEVVHYGVAVFSYRRQS
jgi:hypothetical protein